MLHSKRSWSCRICFSRNRPKPQKLKDHLEALNRRLSLWKEGELTELLIEGETIQKSLSDSKSIKSTAELSKKIKNYMKKGNINAAVKLLTNNMHDGILPLNNETINKLREKHPKSNNANNDVLLVFHGTSTQSCLLVSTRK